MSLLFILLNSVCLRAWLYPGASAKFFFCVRSKFRFFFLLLFPESELLKLNWEIRIGDENCNKFRFYDLIKTQIDR